MKNVIANFPKIISSYKNYDTFAHFRFPGILNIETESPSSDRNDTRIAETVTRLSGNILSKSDRKTPIKT